MRVASCLGTALVLAGLAGTARAGGTVQCSLAPTPLAFGTVETLQAAPNHSTAALDVTCMGLGNAAVPVALSVAAVGAGGAAAGRRMGAVSGLHYQLFIDPGRTVPWGDGTAGTATLTAQGTVLPGVPFRHRFTVYGRVPGRQAEVPAGAQVDSVMAVLSY